MRLESPQNIQSNRTNNIKENETVGPFNCIVDCNPACETTWKNKILNGSTNIISRKNILEKQNLIRNIVSFHCEVKWRTNPKIEKSINFNVLCK